LKEECRLAIRTILTDEDPLLRKISRVIENYDDRLLVLLEDLADTMRKADGVGLAAPQIGVLRRVAVIDVGEGLIELINPKVVHKSEETLCQPEGCLSSPGEYGEVPRPAMVLVEYYDRTGQKRQVSGEGLLARALCHEIDHLNGRLFKDLAQRMLTSEELENL
jgi:peptide deformylase